MEKKSSEAIGTWPTPEIGGEVSVRIPQELLREFGKDLRVVIRHPWLIGIPIPELLLRKAGVLEKLAEEFDLIAVPKR